MSLLISYTDDIGTCRALRRAVFIDEQGIAEADEWDDRDGEAAHMLALWSGQPIGTLRLFATKPQASMGRICVLAAHRGTGVGDALCNAALATLRDVDGVERVKLGAQLHVVEFYRRMGFVPEGPIYDDADIPHRDMVLELRTE
ncbi:putative N-acetyltransferase YjcF [Rhodobacteraceae bacterium THAF1]|uniref:GNAT family N-acetyltransferase n=1 Tax=Palleronia sp. THAF1 TaxID=2587842 RepID=UPI000F41F06A|nr:GNAT family N-acetyltransferase [Palleronia sp. THAF1]QFU07267.1 putative N-acetyltransferase YjcF [Palleronia sp. THAF1]VDC20821.1 putative N-acetyltransferase YjcF [Rhodobacteraceae bacterium THAF1]